MMDQAPNQLTSKDIEQVKKRLADRILVTIEIVTSHYRKKEHSIMIKITSIDPELSMFIFIRSHLYMDFS